MVKIIKNNNLNKKFEINLSTVERQLSDKLMSRMVWIRKYPDNCKTLKYLPNIFILINIY